MANRGIYVKQGGVWKEVTDPRVRVDGIWTRIRAGYVKQGGVWKAFWPSSGTSVFPVGTTNWKVPPGVYQISITAAAGGGGGGDIWDNSNGDDDPSRGAAGGGSSGQMVKNLVMSVTPGDTITVKVGTGGKSQQSGTDTLINTLLLLGGKPGGSGEGYEWYGTYAGGTVPASSIDGVYGNNGAHGSGSTGGTGGNGIFGAGGGKGGQGMNNDPEHGGRNGQSGQNATQAGAGGGGAGTSDVDSGGYSYGGSGADGYAEIKWGPGSDPNYPA